MKNRQNDWGNDSSDGDKKSDSVYNEKEIAYLDKYSEMAKNAIDDNELYDLIFECNFDDDKIEKAVKAKLKYIEAKGEEYGWQKITSRKGKAQPEQTNTKQHESIKNNEDNYLSGNNRDYNNYRNNKSRNSNNTDADAYYSERYYNKNKERPTGPNNSSSNNTNNDHYYNSSHYNNNNASRTYRRNNNNYNTTYNQKFKKKKRPFEECIEVPTDYKPNTNASQDKDEERDKDKDKERDKDKDQAIEIENEKELEKQTQKKRIVLENELKPESNRIQIEPQEPAINTHNEKQHNQEEEEKHEEEDYNDFNSQSFHYKLKMNYNNNEAEYEVDDENQEEEYDEKQWREDQLKLYLNRLKNFKLTEPKKKSSFIQLNEQQQKEETQLKENKNAKFSPYNFEIETMNQYTSVRKQEHKQSERKKNYTQTTVETITINACYDTINRFELISNSSRTASTQTQNQIKPMPLPMEGYMPMMNMTHCIPPYIYPYGYMPPPTKRMNSDKKPEMNPINPYPYPMFIPMYPNPPQKVYEMKPKEEQNQAQLD